MKLCLLLSFLTIVLSVLPCTDGEAMHDHEVSDPLEATQDHGQEGEGCDDLCSPFCVCACCGVSVAAIKASSETQKCLHGNLFSKESHYKEPITEPFIDSLFQPPQV